MKPTQSAVVKQPFIIETRITPRTLAGWLILLNFCFSCAGLTVREDAPAGLVLFVIAWFIVSSALMRWAYKRGMLEMLNRITGEMK